ncbi:unnamed protein product [Symbiodinium sp. CCMP2592]|nr:unnamed protein product [Symbiodinium sp. CCMP2592]
MGFMATSTAFGPSLSDQCMLKPPEPVAEEHEPTPCNFSRMTFRKPPMPDLPEEEPLLDEMSDMRLKPADHPLIEDEDDFEALITFPDGEFARATSTSKDSTASTVDTVGSSMDSASWHRDLPPGTIIPPDRRLHERHLRKMNRFLQDVELAPRTFTGIVKSKRKGSQ